MLDFRAHRQKTFDHMPEGSLAILKAAPIKNRSRDSEFPFRQESYFYYVTGFEEEDAIAVLIKQPHSERFLLFCHPTDASRAQWVGERIGVTAAVKQYGADQAYLLSEIATHLIALLKQVNTVYYLINHQPGFDKQLARWLKEARQQCQKQDHLPAHFSDLRLLLDEQRLVKTPQELQLIRQACEISTEAHIAAMGGCTPGRWEFELEAILLYEFYRRGSRAPAYNSIVASGKRACILHYTQNNAQIQAGDLVLIDAGAEYQNYAADITRTFPANGQFSLAQQSLYECVLAAQEAAIQAVKVGLAWTQLQEIILQVLVEGLVSLGILQGERETLIAEKAYHPFYMHSSGHWLGLDVHDVGAYYQAGEVRTLEAGMVFTIEPGLYIPSHPAVPEKWHGIGIRIEDDILVTTQGADVLTQRVPKTVRDIHVHVGQQKKVYL